MITTAAITMTCSARVGRPGGCLPFICLAGSTLLPLTARTAAAIEAVEVEPSDPQWAYNGGQTGQTPP